MSSPSSVATVFRSNQFTEAWLVKDLLGQHGIAAQVSGQYLAGGLGELPLDQPVKVLVADENAARAEKILQDYWYEKPQPF